MIFFVQNLIKNDPDGWLGVDQDITKYDIEDMRISYGARNTVIDPPVVVNPPATKFTFSIFSVGN